MPGPQNVMMTNFPMGQPMMNNAIFPVPQTNDTTLYVGNLNPGMEESRLFSAFSCFGNIISYKIMRDIFSHNSRRFGFVSFSTVQEAQNARDSLNYTNLDGFEIRICFKKSHSDFKPDANIFIKNISTKATTKQLDELCSQFGKIFSCSIRFSDKGESLGYGYAQFEEVESSKKAIQALNDKDFLGQPLQVTAFVSSKNRPHNKNNLYIRNFPEGMTKEEIEKEITEKFGSFGKISCQGVYEKKGIDTLSFSAFVAYESEESAQKAIDELNGKPLKEGSEALLVTFVIPKRVRALQLQKDAMQFRNTTNLFMRSLKSSVTAEQLISLFSKYGKLSSLIVKPSNPTFLTNDTMNIAFVNFVNSEDASEAYLKAKKDPQILELLHPIHIKTIDFISYFQPKEIRQQYTRIKFKTKMAAMAMNTYMHPINQTFKGRGKPQRGVEAFQGHPIAMRPAYMMPMHPFGQDGSSFSSVVPIQSPSTFNNSTPSSSSRPGEKEEVYNVDWLKKHKNEFQNMKLKQQSSILGNLMYNRVLGSGLADQKIIPKVTGMLIDQEILDYEEIIDILCNDESLKERINEAVDVINEATEESH